MIDQETATRIMVNAFGLGMIAGFFVMLVVNVVAEFVGETICRAVTNLGRRKDKPREASGPIHSEDPCGWQAEAYRYLRHCS